MQRLLVTEADRRQVQIELTLPETGEDDETDAVMDEYEQGLSLVPPLPDDEGDDD